MRGHKFSINNYILPLGLLLAGMIYTVIICISCVFSPFLFPGSSAIVCSLVSIYLIRENKLNINRFLWLYFLTNTFGGIVTILMLFWGMSDRVDAFILAAPIIIPLALIAEWLVLRKKAAHTKEKAVMIIINPVLYFHSLIFMLYFVTIFTRY